MQALLDNLTSRGLDSAVCRLFIIDGAKALSKAIRQTFGRRTPIQRCQIYKARNIVERLPGHLHATVRKTGQVSVSPVPYTLSAATNENGTFAAIARAII